MKIFGDKQKVIRGVQVIELNTSIKSGYTYYALSEELTVDGYVVPKGFITNGASVPKGLRWLISPTGRLFRPSIVHDYMYTIKDPKRATADWVLAKLTLKETYNPLLALVTYLGVRIGGSNPYKGKPFLGDGVLTPLTPEKVDSIWVP